MMGGQSPFDSAIRLAGHGATACLRSPSPFTVAPLYSMWGYAPRVRPQGKADTGKTRQSGRRPYIFVIYGAAHCGGTKEESSSRAR